MRSACGCVRFVHNYMLDVQRKHYETTGKFIPYLELDREYLTPLKKQNDWLREPSKWALQYSCRSLCENLFTFKKNGRGFPKFKKKGRCKEAIHIQESLNIDYDNWMCRIAKVGNVRIYKGHNKRIGNIHSYTIEVKPSLDRYFISMLAYKCENLVKIDKWYASSQTCSECGYVNKVTKDLSVRKWVCPECGAIHDRDLNAARNIEREGLSLCGLKVSGCAVLAPRTPLLSGGSNQYFGECELEKMRTGMASPCRAHWTECSEKMERP